MSFTWADRGIDQLAILRRDMERSNRMQATNPDRTIYDPRGLTRVATLDPLPDTIEGYLNDAGDIVQSGTSDLPRVRINTEARQKGGYKRDETVEFPEVALLTAEGMDRAKRTLAAADELVRWYVELKEGRDRADQEKKRHGE